MSSTKKTLGPVTFQYTHLIDPHAREAGQKEKYSCMVVIDKTDLKNIALVEAGVKAAHAEGSDKLGKSTLRQIRTPLRDGDEKEGMEGKMFFNCSSIRKPKIVGLDRQPILDEDEIYSGMVGYVSINFFAYKASQSKGIGAGLNNILKSADGERFGGGGSSVEDDFADVDVEQIF